MQIGVSIHDDCHPILYSDLDGSFLDASTYSFKRSLSALHAALNIGVTVIFASSKTRAEVERLLSDLGLSLPFIVENGGGIFIPEGYFSFGLRDLPREGPFRVLTLGTPYNTLVSALERIRADLSLTLVGFSEMSVEEVARVCSLSLAEALRAKSRQFDEPFMLRAENEELAASLRAAVVARGLRLHRGDRFFHLTGPSDKGTAVSRLDVFFRKEYGDIFTVGIGDNANDLPMLAAVDLPLLVQKRTGNYDETVLASLPGVTLAQGMGPVGWARVVTDLARAISEEKARRRNGEG